jgi:prevent-host-death family protein
MATATIFEAKTNLSALIKKTQAGETIIITSGRNKTPVAKLSPIDPVQPVAKKRLGVMETPGFVIPDSFWEPLPPGWSGDDD